MEADFPQQTTGGHISVFGMRLLWILSHSDIQPHFFLSDDSEQAQNGFKKKSMQSANPFGHLLLKKKVHFREPPMSDIPKQTNDELSYTSAPPDTLTSPTKWVSCHLNERASKELLMLNLEAVNSF